jgi:DNA-directed RNA polymerase beta subunit
MKMAFKLGLKTKYEDENGKFLNIEDLIISLKYFLSLIYGVENHIVDDIDHLENRRIRSV